MRRRSDKKRARPAARSLRDPLRIQISEQEILDDLLYPAPAPRTRLR